MRRVWWLLALALVLSGCSVKPLGTPFEVPEDREWLLLNLEDGGLIAPSYDPTADPGSADRTAMYGPGEGLQQALAYGGDDYGEPMVFTLTDGLDAPVWLNVSTHIRGDLYFADSTGLTSGVASVTDLRVHLEWFIGGTMAGGQDYSMSLDGFAQNGSPWGVMSVFFRPEARMIPAGESVEVHVYVAATANDLFIGTGEEHQSFLALHVFQNDPLAGTLYLEDGILYQSPPSEPSEDGGEEAAAMAIGGSALLGLAVLSWRRPKMPILAVMVILITALAGCAKDTQDAPLDGVEDDAPFKPKVNQTVEDDPETPTDDPVAPSTGRINGTVADHFDRLLAGAHVSILGTNLFQTTGNGGRFIFPDMTPGDYQLRVDADGLESLETFVSVEAGKVTRLTIQLAPPSDQQGDELAHYHDEWNGQTRRLVDQTTVEPHTSGYLVTQEAGPGACISHYGDASGAQPYHEGYYCDYPVPMNVGARILPGTQTVEVKLDWNTGGLAPQRMGLQYANPVTGSQGLPQSAQRYVAREPGEPFMIQVFPDEADPGHQGFTNWVFYVEVFGDDITSPWHRTMHEMPEVTVEIFGHKGIIPLEPPHRDMWEGRDSIRIVDGDTVSHSTYNSQLPSETHFFAPDDGKLVPPDAQRLEGTLTWSATTLSAAGATPPAITYGLAYKPADVAKSNWDEGLIEVDGDVSGNSMQFVIELSEGEPDQWYQTISYWQFHVTANGDDVTAYRGTVTFDLDVTAYR